MVCAQLSPVLVAEPPPSYLHHPFSEALPGGVIARAAAQAAGLGRLGGASHRDSLGQSVRLSSANAVIRCSLVETGAGSDASGALRLVPPRLSFAYSSGRRVQCFDSAFGVSATSGHTAVYIFARSWISAESR